MATKILIAYYSWSGHTAKLAHQLQAATQADLFEITVAPGTFSQDMYETSEEAKAQLASGKLPVLAYPLPDLAQYDVVLVGGPVWSGVPSTPVRAFLQAAQGASAVFAPFYTHAGTPAQYEDEFKAAAAPLAVAAGFGLPGDHVAADDAQIQAWLARV
ncbi:flavodoxin [Lacticaseibacillus thailandensis]|uniref:Flavodoxin n=1 Tax=Lacticaseibacillus thailandensis DSM 22698 = JCM 13996 TaxID=1423810 RepID=A0A0R2CH12_9LACO|nr:flavodoxin [Lacticaseibacillus thailandensis]KRM86963.1 flavodoxin [Lacticaseibacillus thailandensis DSM 22698 = JCM 13996]